MIESDMSESSARKNTMDLVDEMAALGLPTAFLSRSKILENSTKKCSEAKVEPVKSVEKFEATETEDEPRPAAFFSVSSVKLYTAKELAPQEITLDTMQGVEHDQGGVEAEFYIDGLETQDKDADYRRNESEHSENGEDSVADQGSVEGRSGEVMATNQAIWEAVWDDHYQRYYFCNTQTWESTWEPPPGYEHYGSRLVDWSECSGVDQKHLADYTEISRPESASTLKTNSSDSGMLERPSSPDMVMEGGDESVEAQQTSSTVYEDVSEVRVERSVYDRDMVSQNSTMTMGEDEHADRLPIFARACGVHKRFSDSGDSSVEVLDNDGINWEEIDEAQSATRTGDARQEETEACSPSLGVVAFKDKKGSIQLLSDRPKRRRMKKTLSTIESEKLDKVLLPGMAEMMSQSLIKYWLQRYSLFSRYDEGVRLDEEGWFSVTPEVIAEHQARRCPMGLIVDAFTGVGGNAIQFALKNKYVVAIDINPARVELARHNAEIYGVSDRIEFIVGDFFLLAPSLKADLVFLSPPWGGPQYLDKEKYNIQTMLQPKDGFTLFKTALTIAPNVALFLPRNVELLQLKELAWLSSPPLPCEVEKNYVDNRLKAVTAYYGDLAVKASD